MSNIWNKNTDLGQGQGIFSLVARGSKWVLRNVAWGVSLETDGQSADVMQVTLWCEKTTVRPV